MNRSDITTVPDIAGQDVLPHRGTLEMKSDALLSRLGLDPDELRLSGVAVVRNSQTGTRVRFYLEER